MICMVFLILAVYAVGFACALDTLDCSFRNFILFTKFGNLTGTPEPINRSITLAKYIEHWVSDIGPKKLADSTYQRDLQDIRRILPALGNYRLTDLRKEVIREFYEEMRHTPRLDGRGNLSEKSVEGLHNTLCGILSAAVDEGYLTHILQRFAMEKSANSI